jgi:hypothetical protein
VAPPKETLVSLLPLSPGGTFPESVLPLDSTAKAERHRPCLRLDGRDDPAPDRGAPVKLLTFDRVSFDTAHLFDPTHPTRLRVYVNGHAVSVDRRPPVEETRQVITTLYRLSAGDEVEVGVAQDEAASLDANAVGDYAPSLAIAWIAPG